MRFHAFELYDPVPQLKEPHAFAILKPWIDVSNVGTMVLTELESHLKATPLGEIAEPDKFFDFTRYRPTMSIKEGQRQIQIPNTTLTYAKTEHSHDYIFLHLFEPHALAQTYVSSVLELLQMFGVKRYCFIGSMYDMAPYTRPLLVSGISGSTAIEKELRQANVISSDYQGPTTMTYLISQHGLESGMETLNLIVHLPQYLTLELDYRGKRRIMEVLSSLYGFPLSDEDTQRAREQQEQVIDLAEQFMQQEPSYRLILSQLEAYYDSRIRGVKDKEEIKLDPEVEKFLRDLSKRFRQD